MLEQKQRRASLMLVRRIMKEYEKPHFRRTGSDPFFRSSGLAFFIMPDIIADIGGIIALDALGYLWMNKTRNDRPVLCSNNEDDEFLCAVKDAITKMLSTNERLLSDIINELNGSEEVHKHAIFALGAAGWKKASNLLLLHLDNPKQTKYVRLAIAKALGDMREETALPLLIDCLHDQDLEVAWWAAYALGCLKNDSAVIPLMEALETTDIQFKAFIIEALGKLNSIQSVAALESLKEHENALIREEAKKALSSLSSKRLK